MSQIETPLANVDDAADRFLTPTILERPDNLAGRTLLWRHEDFARDLAPSAHTPRHFRSPDRNKPR